MNRATRAALAFVVPGGLWVACTSSEFHIFVAGQYIPDMDCVTPGEAVDVQDGYGIDAACDATCIVPPYEAGVYISGQCAPFPPGDLVNPQEGGLRELCAKGLAAIHRNDLCLEGGPSNPIDAAALAVADSGSDHAAVTPDAAGD